VRASLPLPSPASRFPFPPPSRRRQRQALGDDVFGALAALEPHEALAFLEGQRHLTPELLLACCAFRGGSGDEALWFAEAVRALPAADLPLLLRFATGHGRLGAGGALVPSPSGQTAIEVRFIDGAQPGDLPVAHTCFYQLDLPHYPSAEALREKLALAVTSDPAMGIV